MAIHALEETPTLDDDGAPSGLEWDRRETVTLSERPWGCFQQFTCNERVTVKTLMVDPGQRLSLQRHAHRAELWQLLDYPLEITLGDQVFTASPTEMVWVPRGALHRIANTGTHMAHVLEIAFGAFDECDIERFDDDYDRT